MPKGSRRNQGNELVLQLRKRLEEALRRAFRTTINYNIFSAFVMTLIEENGISRQFYLVRFQVTLITPKNCDFDNLLLLIQT